MSSKRRSTSPTRTSRRRWRPTIRRSALVDQAHAGFWPTVAANLSRLRGSGRGGASTVTADTATTVTPTGASTSTTYSAGASANWTLDIWGQIRRTVESDRASAQASAAALAAAQLVGAGHARHRLLRAARAGSAAEAARRHGDRRAAVAEDHREPLSLRRRRQGRCGERRGAAAVQPGAADQCEDPARARSSTPSPC